MTRKEAIERIKARFDKWALDDEDMKAIQTLIPELSESESEDERIRKALIDLVCTVGEYYLPKLEVRNKMLDYLEKQKEPENTSASTMAPSCWEVEQKEQKPCWNPTEEDVALFNKAITTNTSLSPQERAKLDILRMKFKHRPVIEQKEQKTADLSEMMVHKEPYIAPVPTPIVADEQKSTEWNEKHIADVFEKVGLAKIVREQANDALTNAVQSAMLELSKVGNVEWSEDFEENIRKLLHDKLTWHSEDGRVSSTVLLDDKTLKGIINGIWFYVGKELNVTEWNEEDERNRDRALFYVRNYEKK